MCSCVCVYWARIKLAVICASMGLQTFCNVHLSVCVFVYLCTHTVHISPVLPLLLSLYWLCVCVCARGRRRFSVTTQQTSVVPLLGGEPSPYWLFRLLFQSVLHIVNHAAMHNQTSPPTQTPSYFPTRRIPLTPPPPQIPLSDTIKKLPHTKCCNDCYIFITVFFKDCSFAVCMCVCICMNKCENTVMQLLSCSFIRSQH